MNLYFRKYVDAVTDLLNKQPNKDEKQQAAKENISQALNFQALIKPNRAQLDQVSQISRLEERLRKLESTIGSSALTLVRLFNIFEFSSVYIISLIV